jgi:hypothetical protein
MPGTKQTLSDTLSGTNENTICRLAGEKNVSCMMPTHYRDSEIGCPDAHEGISAFAPWTFT